LLFQTKTFIGTAIMSKKLTALTLTLITCLCTGCAVNPITGRQRLMLISEEQDVTIGRKYAPQIEKQMGGKIPDPAIQRYIDTVGQNIARVSHNPTLQCHFVALNHNSVNAFALRRNLRRHPAGRYRGNQSNTPNPKPQIQQRARATGRFGRPRLYGPRRLQPIRYD
jgi:hypothetical protein